MKTYTKDEVLEALKNGGTAFRYNDKDRERILKSPNLKELLAGLHECAEEIREKPILELPYTAFRRFFTDGDRMQYEHTENGYFSRRVKLATFGILYWLERKPCDLDVLCDTIWAILNEYTWCLPAHVHHDWEIDEDDCYTVDLFSAETGESLAEILSLVGDDLPPLIIRRIKREVEERIFSAYVKQEGWWKRGDTNWTAVCEGSVGIAAMYLIDDKERLANDFITPMIESMGCFINGFTDDGACLEGVDYWHYGFGFFLAFADMLDRYTSGKIDLFKDEKVHKVAGFLDKTLLPGGNCVPFADGPSRAAYYVNELGIFLRKYPETTVIPMRKYIGFRYAKKGSLSFAFRLRNLIEGASDWVWNGEKEPGTCTLFPDAQWFIYSSKDGFSLVAKGGHNKEPHNHNDVGTFSVFGKHGSLLNDLGPGLYTKQYFSSDRYTFLETSSRGHNLPIIDDSYQSSGKDHCASNVKMTKTHFSLNLEKAYNKEKIHIINREINVLSDSHFVLSDTFVFIDSGCSLKERFVTKSTVNENGNVIIISNGKEKLTITPAFECKPIISSDYTSRGNQTVYLIDFPIEVNDKNANALFDFTFEKLD